MAAYPQIEPLGYPIRTAGLPLSLAQRGVVQEEISLPSYDFVYDFDESGGLVGTIPLVGDNQIPAGFVIVDCFKEVITPLDSANHTATGALTSGEAANDLLTATVVSNAAWTATGTTKLSIVEKLTAARTPALVIAVQNLTQGKFKLHISGYVAP
jgi:hypothetical protein